MVMSHQGTAPKGHSPTRSMSRGRGTFGCQTGLVLMFVALSTNEPLPIAIIYIYMFV